MCRPTLTHIQPPAPVVPSMISPPVIVFKPSAVATKVLGTKHSRALTLIMDVQATVLYLNPWDHTSGSMLLKVITSQGFKTNFKFSCAINDTLLQECWARRVEVFEFGVENETSRFC